MAYWVGGSGGNWADPTKWSSSSGGTAADTLGSDLLSGWNFTSGWTISDVATTIIDSNSFSTTSLTGIYKSGILTIGKAYKIVFSGATTSSNVNLRNAAGAYANLIGTGFGTFYFVASTTSIFIHNSNAGTTDITTFTCEEVTCYPSSTVDAIFDANSFSSDSQTVTINAANCACKNLDFSAIDQTVTFANASYNFEIYGDIVLPATKLTWSFTGVGFTYLKATSSKTITTNGMTSNMNRLYFDSTTGTWTNQDAANFGSTALFLTNGTWNTNNYNITTTNSMGLTDGTKTLTLGSSVVTVRRWYTSNPGLTFNYNTSTVVITGNTSNNILTGTFYNLTLEGASSTSSASVWATNVTVTNVLTINGINATDYRILVCSDTIGTQRTITAASISASNVDFRDIKLAGACSKDLSAITGGSGDCGGNTDITFSTPETKYYKHTSGACTWKDTTKWVTTSGGSTTSTARFLPQDSHILDANSFTGTSTLTIDVPRKGSVDMSAVNQAVTTSLANNVEHYGNLILGNNITPSGNYTRSLMGRGSYNISLYGKTIPYLYFRAGDYTNLSNLSVQYNINIYAGASAIVRFNNFDVSCQYISNSSTLYLGDGIITITNTISNTGFETFGTIYAGNSTIKLNPASGSYNVTFAGGGKTYNKVEFSGLHSGYFDITGSNTFNELKIDPGRKVRITAGTTQTVSKLNAVGTQANPITLTSVTSATHTFAYSGTDPVRVDWCDISYSIAPTNKFYANNSLNRASNTNWIFNSNYVFNYNAIKGGFYSDNGILGVSSGSPAFVQKEKGYCIKLESGKSISWTIPSAFISDIISLASGNGTLRISCGANNTDISITRWTNTRTQVVYSAITTITATATSGYVYLLGLYLYTNIDTNSLNNITNSYNISAPLSKPKFNFNYPRPTDLSSFTNMTIGNGLLYNWYAVAGIDGTGVTKTLAPAGCHIPTDAEWTTLSTYLGGDSVSGGKLKSINSIFWGTPNTGATNESGFAALGSGYRSTSGTFTNFSFNGYFWSSSEDSTTNAWYCNLIHNSADVYRSNGSKGYGFSVRCICDTPYFLGQVITDVDGNRYGTVLIGTQTWLTSNLKTTKYADGTSIPNVTNNSAWAALTTGAYCSYNNAAIVKISQPFSNNGLKAAYNFIPQNKTGNILADISGNGKSGTISSAIMNKSYMSFDGINDKVTFTTLGYPNTICFRIKLSTTTQKIMEGKANANLIHVSSGTLTASKFATKYVDGNAGSTMVANQWQTVVLVSSSGVEFSACTLGLNNVTYGKFDIEDLRFYNYAFNAAQARNYHNLFSNTSFTEDFKFEKADGLPVIPKGWIKGTGVYKIVESSSDDPILKHITKGTKFLECTVAGTASIPFKFAYGTWEFDIYVKSGTSAVNRVYFINKSSTEGYAITYNREYRNTGITNYNSSIIYCLSTINYFPVNTYFNVKITRTKTGTVTYYINNIIVSVSSGTNPFTNTSVNESNTFEISFYPGSKIGNITWKPYIDRYLVGQAGEAGIVFYDKGSYSNGWRYLECATSDQSTGIQWSTSNSVTRATATAIGTGNTNTTTIVNALGAGTYAAKLCYDLTLNGKSDWFLPSKNELALMYSVLKVNGIGGFTEDYYHSSSESNYQNSWYQSFWDGSIGYGTKNNTYYVRAIRAF